MFSSTLLNIVLFLPNKSSTSSYCPNALLKLHFWPLFWNLLLLLPPPDRCPLKLPLLSHCPLTPQFPLCCSLKPRLHSSIAVLRSCDILSQELWALVALRFLHGLEQQTGCKLGKEYVKAVSLTYMQSTPCKTLCWISTSSNQDCQEKYL